MATEFRKIHSDEYVRLLAHAAELYPELLEAVDPTYASLAGHAEIEPEHVHYYASIDGTTAFFVANNEIWAWDLRGLFNIGPKGQGAEAVRFVQATYAAVTLDCFVPLDAYYSRFGFVEYDRQANWTEGGPDVTYLEWQRP